MPSTESESNSGATSLSDALHVAVAWLDGDVDASVSMRNTNNVESEKDGSGVAAEVNGLEDIANRSLIEKSIDMLTDLQSRVTRAGLISPNELLDDVSTWALELLSVEYHLGRALLMLPTHQAAGHGGQSASLSRRRNVIRSMEYFHFFLKRLEQLGQGLLEDATLKEYHALLDLEEGSSRNKLNAALIRDIKIQRYQRKKSASSKLSQLRSLMQRRSRLGIQEEEEMEGHDYESLRRTLFTEQLRMFAEESLEELQNSKSELEMLDMALRMESVKNSTSADPRMMQGNAGDGRPGIPPPQSQPAAPPHNSKQSSRPLQLTQITKDPNTGQLRIQPIHQHHHQPIQKQQIANTVFRPSWNQPTMSLAEFAERERRDAIQRSEIQKQAEQEAKFKPKRYDQLVKDGLEDDANLVEQSARLDREWDDWKEENPRGSGNKLGERGDRNF